MPEDNGSLTYGDRKLIEVCLDKRLPFAVIARKAGVHPTTVKREVIRNRIVREGRINVNATARNICKNKGVCTVTGICGPHCQARCVECKALRCSTRCELYEPRLCERLDRKPFVCNGCELLDFRGVCDRQRMFYDAVSAQEQAEANKLKSGRKIALSEKQVADMAEFLKGELKKGHSPENIWARNPGKMPISVRTFYNYLEWGLFEELKMLLPRYVRYSRPKKRKKKEVPPNPVYDGRRYEDFKALPEGEKAKAVELDCVEGLKDGCSKVILTLLFRDMRFQVMLMLHAHTKDEVKRALDRIERIIGLEAFKEHFGLQLTDHGHEFNDFELLEASCTVSGEKRCKVYYCDPSRPDQKGACERNHSEMRKVIPNKKVKKKASFKNLTERDVQLLCSHVNSYGRPILGHKAPIELAKERLPTELFEELGIKEIEPENVILKPSLLPHLF